MSSYMLSLITTLSVSVLLASPPPAAQPKLDVKSYDIKVDVLENKLVEDVKIHVVGDARPSKWKLDLYGSLSVKSAKVGDLCVPFQPNRGAVELDLTKVPVNGPIGFVIALEVEGRAYNKQNRTGYVRTTVSPERTYIRGQYAWYPRVDNDPATYRTEALVPKGWMVKTAGVGSGPTELGNRTSWVFERKAPTWQIGLVAGPYERVQLQASGAMVLDALVFPEHKDGGKELLRVTKQAYELYCRRYGNVDSKGFSLVEMPDAFGKGSGYGEAGYVLIGSGAFENGGRASWAEGLVAHEVGHTWWGEEVRFRNFTSETLACYATLCYLAEVKGEEAACDARRTAVERVVQAAQRGKEIAFDQIRAWGRGMDPITYRTHAYEKGMMVLSMIADAVGAKALDKALARFFADSRGKLVDYPAFRSALFKYCPKCRPILTRYEYPGIPVIKLDYETRKAGRNHKLVGSLTLEGAAKPVGCTVDVVTKCGEREINTRVKFRGRKKAFSLTVPAEPDAVVVDPGYRILAIRPHSGLIDAKVMFDEAMKVVGNPESADPDTLRSAIGRFEQVLKGDPGIYRSVCYTGIGRCRFRLGEFRKAVAAFEKSLALGSGGPFHRAWVYLRLGNIADVQGAREKAIGFYKKAVAQGTRYYQAKRAAKYLNRPYRGYRDEG